MRNKIIIILTCCLLFVVGISIGINITIKNKEINSFINGSEYYVNNIGNVSIQKTDNNDYTNNITLYKFSYVTKNTTLDRKFQIYAKNNNMNFTKIEFELDFFDENGYQVDLLTKKATILPNTEFVVEIDYLDNSTYNSYRIKYKASESLNNIVLNNDIDKIKYSSIKRTDGSIFISFNNETNKKIDYIYFSCILYKDDLVVDTLVGKNENVLPNNGGIAECKPANSELLYNNYKVYLSQIDDEKNGDE